MIMKFLRIFHESFKFSNFRLVKYSSIETFSRTSPESLINRDFGYNYQPVREFFINLSNFQIFAYRNIYLPKLSLTFFKYPNRKRSGYNYNIFSQIFARVLSEFTKLKSFQFFKFTNFHPFFTSSSRIWKFSNSLEIYEFPSFIFQNFLPKKEN